MKVAGSTIFFMSGPGYTHRFVSDLKIEHMSQCHGSISQPPLEQMMIVVILVHLTPREQTYVVTA